MHNTIPEARRQALRLGKGEHSWCRHWEDGVGKVIQHTVVFPDATVVWVDCNIAILVTPTGAPGGHLEFGESWEDLRQLFSAYPTLKRYDINGNLVPLYADN